MKVAIILVGGCGECPHYDNDNKKCFLTEEDTCSTCMPDDCPLDDE